MSIKIKNPIQESFIDNINNIDNINKIDNLYYQTLYEINNLFQNINFKSKIGSKTDPNSINQTIIYYNPINITEEFIINIYNKYAISVTAEPVHACSNSTKFAFLSLLALSSKRIFI